MGGARGSLIFEVTLRSELVAPVEVLLVGLYNRRMQEMQVEERESANVIADAIMEGQERRMNAAALAKVPHSRVLIPAIK